MCTTPAASKRAARSASTAGVVGEVDELGLGAAGAEDHEVAEAFEKGLDDLVVGDAPAEELVGAFEGDAGVAVGEESMRSPTSWRSGRPSSSSSSLAVSFFFARGHHAVEEREGVVH